MADEIKASIAELEKLMSDEADAEAIREGVDKLQQAAMKMGEAIYKSQSEEGEDKPKDADEEKEEKDEKKKDEKKE